jgi:hypothetical protein
MATFNALLLYGYRPISAAIVRYWSAITVVAALFDCLAIAALTLAASATEHSICRKNKRPPVASASPPQNCASSSVVGPTFANQCHQSPNGRAAETYQRICNEIQALEAKATHVFFIDKSPYAPWAGRLIETEMRRLLVVSRVSRYPEEGERISQILTRMAETSAVSVRFLSGALSAKK